MIVSFSTVRKCINLTSTFRTIIELNKNPLFGVAVLLRFFFVCVKNHVEVGVASPIKDVFNVTIVDCLFDRLATRLIEWVGRKTGA